MKKKLLAVIFSMLLCLPIMMGLAACGGNGSDEGDKDGTTVEKVVESIEIKTKPSKIEYYVGETFSLEGGMLLVTYEDDSTEEVALTAEGVTCTNPDMNNPGNKTITVTYEGERTRFSISVVNQGFKLTLDYNYDGAENTVINVTKGDEADEPATPVRSGYTFYAWYIDEACTMEYDFDTPVKADITIYAAWNEDGATYYEATYDLNYYGVAPQTYTQIVKQGESVKDLVFTPERAEYEFEGWFTDAACTTAFTDKAIGADTVIYAGWTKTKTQASTYVFEAEDTDLTGKSGPGFSGTAQEEGMIVTNATANGEKAVSYLYQRNLTLDFYIASGEAVSDATVVISIAAELDNINFNSDEFQILINGEAASYTAVSLVNDKTFRDGITITGVSLEEGANLIQLKVNNAKRPLGDASTYAATAPMVDCIKITTSAVLSWDANYGLPMEY